MARAPPLALLSRLYPSRLFPLSPALRQPPPFPPPSNHHQFSDNFCFGHTFDTCLDPDAACPIKSAVLSTCLRAAPVFLTNTDTMGIYFNAVAAWGTSLSPYGVGGRWRPGNEACIDLDLAALPVAGGGTLNVIPLLQAAGSLDFVVQDDTAVDFVTLKVEYENCQQCLPKEVSINGVYTAEGVTESEDVRGCACTGVGECKRLPLHTTYFPSTVFQTTIDVGQCAGQCDAGVCVPAKQRLQAIRGPHGTKVVPVIASCECKKRTLAGDDDVKVPPLPERPL